MSENQNGTFSSSPQETMLLGLFFNEPQEKVNNKQLDLNNRKFPKLAPLPQGVHTKNREYMCKTYAHHCISVIYLSSNTVKLVHAPPVP